MWDISNTTTWIKGNHTFNVGANYRRWWLQRDLATDFTGNFGFGAGFTSPAARSRTSCSATTRAPPPSSPRASAVPGQVGNPREMNFMYFAPYIQDDWKVNSQAHAQPGPALRLPQRALRDERPHGLAQPELRRRAASSWRTQACSRGDQRRQRYYQAAGRRSPENPDRYKVFAPRLGFAYRPDGVGKTVIRGGWGRFYDSAEGREIDGAADIYPYVSRGIYSRSRWVRRHRT